jgi:hypothetical protein
MLLVDVVISEGPAMVRRRTMQRGRRHGVLHHARCAPRLLLCAAADGFRRPAPLPVQGLQAAGGRRLPHLPFSSSLCAGFKISAEFREIR